MADSGTILAFWHAALGPEVGRAERLLATAGVPDAADLTLGDAARRLIALRENLLDDHLDCIATCPACAVVNEAGFPLSTLTVAVAASAPVEVTAEGWHATARHLSLADLADAGQATDTAAAAALLRQRAMLSLTPPDKVPADIPDALVAAIEDALDAADPLADAQIGFTCAACGETWEVALDPAALLAEELDVVARRALAEVAALARAYGWSEADILAMPAARRRIYLDLVQ